MVESRKRRSSALVATGMAMTTVGLVADLPKLGKCGLLIGGVLMCVAAVAISVRKRRPT